MNFEAAQKAIRVVAGQWYDISMTLAQAVKAVRLFENSYRRRGKWKMTAKSGRNKKERQRDQVRLKGRGCRIHRGRYPSRGKGTTSRSR